MKISSRFSGLSRVTGMIAVTSVILLAALLGSLGEIYLQVREHGITRFTQDAQVRFDTIQTQIVTAEAVTETIGRFLDVTPHVTSISFAAFLSGITHDDPWLEAIGWAPISGPQTARHARIELAEPLMYQHLFRGQDLFSNTLVHAAIDRAVTSAATIALRIPGIPLSKTSDVVVFLRPVYFDRAVEGLDLPLWRQSAIRGFAVVIIHLNSLVSVGTDALPDIGITVALSDTPPGTAASGGLRMVDTLHAAGEKWYLTAATKPDSSFYGPSPEVKLLLVFCAAFLALTIVVAAISFRSLALRSIVIRRLNLDLSEQARFTRNILDTIRSPVVIVDSRGVILASNWAWNEWFAASPGRGATQVYLEQMTQPSFGLSVTHGLALRTAFNLAVEGLEEQRECDIRISPNGRPASWYTVSLRTISHLGQPHVLLLHSDVTRLKSAETELRQLAITDGLTQVTNRRYFNERLEEEFARCQRYGRPLVLIMLDVDYFKKINDSFGHPAGDAVLRRIAEICRAHIRELDLVSRFGGEEFVMLLPETDMVGAIQVAERVRQGIMNSVIYHDHHAITSTASLGVAELSETTADAEALLRAADTALYEAKKSGRNRVVAHSTGIIPVARANDR